MHNLEELETELKNLEEPKVKGQYFGENRVKFDYDNKKPLHNNATIVGGVLSSGKNL